jgi:hypothetical protein
MKMEHREKMKEKIRRKVKEKWTESEWVEYKYGSVLLLCLKWECVTETWQRENTEPYSLLFIIYCYKKKFKYCKSNK